MFRRCHCVPPLSVYIAEPLSAVYCEENMTKNSMNVKYMAFGKIFCLRDVRGGTSGTDAEFKTGRISCGMREKTEAGEHYLLQLTMYFKALQP